jgi:hypothetical protein
VVGAAQAQDDSLSRPATTPDSWVDSWQLPGSWPGRIFSAPQCSASTTLNETWLAGVLERNAGGGHTGASLTHVDS